MIRKSGYIQNIAKIDFFHYNLPIMQTLKKALKTQPVVYVTRDIERAIGIHDYKNYYIITNHTPFAKSMAKHSSNIIIVKNKKLLSTHELLEQPSVKKFINKLKLPAIVVFKNTSPIEKICAVNGWKLLNPPAELSGMVEQKISQIKWLGTLAKYLPPHELKLCKDLKWKNEKFIVQFNFAHTGGGTILIESEKQIQELAKQFPNREIRVSKFISGPIFTNNNVVWDKEVLIGNINYQITGLPPFTDLPFATIGNDWTLPRKLLSNKQIKQYKKMAEDIGKKLAKDGWKGLFGIDVVSEEKTGKLYLIEINARQPASTTYESQLQRKATSYKLQATSLLTTFEAHLAALLELRTPNSELRTITDGAQIIQRVTPTSYKLQPTSFTQFTLIPYTNTAPGSDLLRIQSKQGIMAEHNKFNDIGKEILNKILICK